MSAVLPFASGIGIALSGYLYFSWKPHHLVSKITNGPEAVTFLRSMKATSTDNLVDKVAICMQSEGLSDDACEKFMDLLNKVNDPIGEEAFAFTVLYSTAIVVLKRI
jgi:hypothetical protein